MRKPPAGVRSRWVDDGCRAFAAAMERGQEETGTARGRGKGKEIPRFDTRP